jgi:hypothetical protein
MKLVPKIRTKFATLRNEVCHIDINGFQLKTTVDNIDELFEDPIIRYCVNSVFFVLDKSRQDLINHDSPNVLSGFDNVANIEDQRVHIKVKVDDIDNTYPRYCVKDSTGTSWDIHTNKDAPNNLQKINYETGLLDKEESTSIH